MSANSWLGAVHTQSDLINKKTTTKTQKNVYTFFTCTEKSAADYECTGNQSFRPLMMRVRILFRNKNRLKDNRDKIRNLCVFFSFCTNIHKFETKVHLSEGALKVVILVRTWRCWRCWRWLYTVRCVVHPLYP